MNKVILITQTNIILDKTDKTFMIKSKFQAKKCEPKLENLI